MAIAFFADNITARVLDRPRQHRPILSEDLPQLRRLDLKPTQPHNRRPIRRLDTRQTPD
jgi:hypothetical protein